MDKQVFHGLKLGAYCGAGGYGEVRLCEDISGRQMAVKIINKKKFGDSWQRELQGVVNYRRITENAPGLLRIFHVEEDEENFFYTMEAADSACENKYVPDTLAHRLQSGALPEDELYGTLYEIFNGIKLIHDAGFVHRDIKPDNILFVKGMPKLADIGLLSSLSVSRSMLAGTLDFIPPERRAEDSLESTDPLSRQRNDLYAFGKVVYCAATGNGPHEYPATPPDMPLTPALKYFFRLSCGLCSKAPELRLDSVEKVEQEFAAIKHKLEHGESFRDKTAYCLKKFVSGVKHTFFSAGRFLKRYWHFVLLLILVGGATAYWIWKPAPPIDINDLKNKQYVNEEHGVSMTVPYHWEIVPRGNMVDLFKKVLKEGDGKHPLNKEQLDIIIKSAETFGQHMILCDFDELFADNVTISVANNMTEKNIRETPLENFRMMLKFAYEGQLGFKTEIFDAAKITLAGHPAICVDAGINMASGIRIFAFWIGKKDKILIISLTSKKDTFTQRKAEFDAVIKTLKIGK